MTCALCRYYDKDFYLADPNDPPEDQIGECQWPSGNLPYSLRFGSRERVPVRPVDGEGCKGFERKAATQ